MERSVQLPSGEVPAQRYLSEVFADTLIHTFDLVQAASGDERLDPSAVGVCSTWFGGVEDEWRCGGNIGPAAAVPPDADAQTRLLARFGREP